MGDPSRETLKLAAEREALSRRTAADALRLLHKQEQLHALELADYDARFAALRLAHDKLKHELRELQYLVEGEP